MAEERFGIGELEILPDAVSAAGFDRQELLNDSAAVKKQSEDLLTRIQSQVMSDLDVCIEPCRLSSEECEACVRGSLDREIEYVAGVANKVSDKVMTGIDSVMGQLVHSMQVIGIDPPNESQFAAAMAKKDIPPPELRGSPQPIAIVEPPVGGPPNQPPPITPPSTGLNCPPPELIQTLPDGSQLYRVYVPVRGPGGIIIACEEHIERSPPPNPTLPGGGGGGGGTVPGGGGGGDECPVGSEPHSTVSAICGPTAVGRVVDQFGQAACCEPIGPPPPDKCLPPVVECPPGFKPVTQSDGTVKCVEECPPCEGPPPPPPPPRPPSEPAEINNVVYCDPKDWKTWQNQTDTLRSFEAQQEQIANEEAKSKWQQIREAVGAAWNKLFRSATQAFATSIWDKVAGSIKAAATTELQRTNCPEPAWTSWNRRNFLVEWAHSAGTISGPLLKQWQYIGNSICQLEIPSVDVVTTCYVRGEIDKDQWDMGVRLNGVCVPWQQKVVDAEKWRADLIAAYRLFKLEKIDKEKYESIVKRNGVMGEDDRKLFEQVIKQYPQMADLIRMMVRDSADEQAVIDNEFDKDFDKKWVKTLKKWGESQGVDDEIAKMFWRSHWDLPSPTQLYEILHRLREDDRPINHLEEWGTVTFDEVQKVLEQNDMAPRWIKPLMAISYPPLTRVDTRRAYEIGVIDEDELRQSYRDLGYDKTNADRLVEFTKIDSGPKRAKRDGALSENALRDAYVKSLLSADEFKQGLMTLHNDEERVDKIYQWTTVQKGLAERKETVAAYRKRYMTGEFDDSDTVSKLINSGIAPDNAISLVRQWGYVRDAKYKAPTVAMLCQWWTRGLIDIETYMRRCRNLGFSMEDADRIVRLCGLKKQDQLLKEAEKLRKAAIAEAEKRRKAAERRIKEAAPCRVVKPKCPALGEPAANGAAGR